MSPTAMRMNPTETPSTDAKITGKRPAIITTK
eukprot:CAMPEP_0170585588 /NCGR_PEP_ID=MMETSP0224-20130122/9295_1 /TAXON_ID=285029 /ORGANISM="Togula jolla, Strain CCCM 725" /LENGTH=31 /DNA_ID= /DNA_START= /DNA_END= /DNA_ORIENTATION=